MSNRKLVPDTPGASVLVVLVYVGMALFIAGCALVGGIGGALIGVGLLVMAWASIALCFMED